MKKDMIFLEFSDNNPKASMTQENSHRKFTTEMTLFVVRDIENRTSYPMLMDMFSKDGQAQCLRRKLFTRICQFVSMDDLKATIKAGQ